MNSNTNQPKKPGKQGIVTKVLIVVVITIITLTVFFQFVDFEETMTALRNVSGIYIVSAILCLVFYLLLWPLSICIITRLSGLKNHFLDTYLIGQTEHFFNGVTPFSTGGQPIQVYLYTKSGVSAAQSTGIILTNFVAYLIATNVLAIASLVLYGRFSVNFNASTSWMIFLGFIMNFFTLVFMILMATSKKIRDILKRFLLLLCKIKFIGKYLTKLVPVFDSYCENAQLAARSIFKNKTGFVLAILVRGISVLFYYAIPFFILKALGVNLGWDVLPYTMLASAFAITTMVWVPTPGGTGGIEFAFTTIFTTFVGVTMEVALAGTLIWRGITYYLLLIISFLFYLTFNLIIRKKYQLNKGEVEDDSCITERE